MQERIVIGEILKPQGIRGELKVKPLLDEIGDIRKIRKVIIAGEEYKVLSSRFDASAAYLSLSGIADRNAAELFRGKLLEVLREDAPAPAEGRYFIVDIIGCELYTEQGEKLGEIVDILPAHTDVYVVRAGEREWMFAAAEGVIADVDVQAKKVTVNRERFLQVALEQ